MPLLLRSTSLLGVALGVTCLFALHPYGSLQASSSQAALQAQGAVLFAEKGCAHCHGESGFGGSDSGPDLSHVRKELRSAEIAQQIHDGGNNMPPFGDSLTDEELGALVAYLHGKRKPPAGYRPHLPSAAPPAAPVTPKQDPD